MELEICVESVESAIAAEKGGADRVELCASLAEGGLTPSLGMIHAVRGAINIGIYVMIRPRGGDFLYSDAEFRIMRQDIELARKAGADGLVLGLLNADGSVDVERTAELVSLAGPMKVTFHRAMDMARDRESALEAVISTGAARVLTSGGANTAVDGASALRTLVEQSRGRIGIMVAGNVRPGTLQQLAEQTGAHQFHAALRAPVPSPMIWRNEALHLGAKSSTEFTRHVVRASDVRKLRDAMNAVEASVQV